jgi:predicted DNA-binding helix-hairpin-helix protein
MHPEIFPLDINQASKLELLRVPGLGPITVNRILKYRRKGRISRIESIAKPGKLANKAKQYLKF